MSKINNHLFERKKIGQIYFLYMSYDRVEMGGNYLQKYLNVSYSHMHKGKKTALHLLFEVGRA